MSEDKIQAERDEISKIISDSFDPQNGDKYDASDFEWSACQVQNAGYRKASDVAEEIFAEIDEALHKMATEYCLAGHPEYFAVCEMVHHKVIRPVEQKYTEGKS